MRHPGAVLLLLSASSWSVAEPAGRDLSPLGAQSLLSTSGGLLLILVLIFAAAWLYKRFGSLPMLGKGAIRILGGVSVGPRERVLLLEVEDARLLVGVAPGQVRMLHVLAPPSATEDFAAQLARVERVEVAEDKP